MTLRQQQEYLVCNRRFPFLLYYCLHFPIATNRITKPFMTLWQRQENFVCNRRFPFLPYCCVHSLIATNRITKPFMTLWQLQEYLVRNRTFLFLPYYCVHSPIATNRITMRFAVRSAQPPKRHLFPIQQGIPVLYRSPCQRRNLERLTAAGGIWSGSQPQAELEAAHSRKNGRHVLSVPAVLFLSISRCQTAL